jgi:hypothetical protein
MSAPSCASTAKGVRSDPGTSSTTHLRQGYLGNVLGDYRTRRDDRVLAYCDATDDGCTGRDPYVFFETLQAEGSLKNPQSR